MHPAPSASSSFGECFQFFPAEMYHHHQQQDGTLEAVLWQPVTAPAPAERGEPGGALAGAARKRPFRTDRHSKIRTAQGVRDRRMRLSLDVARKFFALQDMLGFDKASKTVQWLLNTSKGAIKEVMTDEASSDCEEDGSSSLSVADGKHKQPGTEAGGGDHADGKKPAPRASKRAPANPKPQRKLASAHLIPDKESRTKARERARERTREKNRMRWVTLASTINIEPATTGMAAARLDELVTSPNNLINRSSSMNTPGAELEEGCSSSMPSEAIMAGFGNGGYGSIGNYYQHQLEQQWELGGVVFANSQHY